MRTNYDPDYNKDYTSYEQENGYPVSDRRRRTWKENGTIAGLMVVGTGLMIVDLSIHNMIMASLAFATAIVALMPKEANSLLSNFEKWQRKYGINIYTIMFCLVGAVFLLDMSVAPASAQFMNSAEKFFTNDKYFPGIDKKITGFIFAVLRGLFLIYLAIGLIRVVQAARNDEDWQTIARTPIIIAITVVIGDILAGLVVGTGGG
ncbi:hypothetical protein [Brasilonema sp. UFV-L1]|uniref:hypothetical protein n=1 Tax=Brasilonema sp. UFV-L1 TaxID=2234130 RepID=UPI00145E29D7|nr:hypothetical protein [Brasilonema sp. UFV-L1]NMG10915.1 hypothetical protein [Brasilonema sp. UFV-L1]